MKKLLVFLVCLLCLTLCIVACGKKNGSSDESTEPAGTGDINWTDLASGTNGTDGTNGTTGGIDGPVHTYDIGEDTDEGFGPLQPFN